MDNTAKHLVMLYLGFNKCRIAEQASGWCSNLRTTFFTATGVTHPLSSTLSSLYRPGNNELNQDRALILSISFTHTHTSWIVLQKKKKHNMNNLQPDLRSAPSLPAPGKSERKMSHASAIFLHTQDDSLNRKCELWSSCAWRCSASTKGDHSRNRSLQSGCELEDTFTVRADECLSINDQNITVIPLQAMISGQLQRLFVLEKKRTYVKLVIGSHLSWKKAKTIVVSCSFKNLSIQTCWMF